MAWLLTFADLVSLLITFFVLLYSMKQTDSQKWALINGSFQGIFAVEKPVIQVRPDQFQTVERVDIIASDPLSYLRVLIEQTVDENTQLAGITVTRNRVEDTLVISVPSNLLFVSSGSNLSRNGEYAMKMLIERLRNIDNRLEVVAHTDPFPVSSKTYPTNWELGISRAVAVGKMLMDAGLPGPIPFTTFADTRFELADPSMSRAEKLQYARRVEIVVFNEK